MIGARSDRTRAPVARAWQWRRHRDGHCVPSFHNVQCDTNDDGLTVDSDRELEGLMPLLSFEPDMEFELSPGKLAALGSVALAATRVANINPGELIWPVLMV